MLVLLNARQRRELVNYLLDSEKQQNNLADSPCAIPETYKVQTVIDEPFTEIQMNNLYFCQEQRLVCIGEQVIELTAKEFDILALLITHPKRVFTYELIMELVWNEDYSYYSRKAVNNHISNLRKKLKITPDSPDYIKSVVGVGYKFEVP
nr:response regulator transcription factor [Neglectibacter sp. M00184]HDT8222597.1 response regulator transcription factor [Enterococcus faecium]